MNRWRPSAGPEALLARAELYQTIREFFARKGVLEVDTPCLGDHGVTDPHIENISILLGGKARFLQSSPEYFMKRLLAAGSGDIYQMGHVFRGGEQGRLHNPEFVLLEWYRLGFDHFALMEEVAELVDLCLGTARDQRDQWKEPRHYSYRQLLIEAQGEDLLELERPELARLAWERLRLYSAEGMDSDTLLDAFYANAVESLGKGRMFVHSFPPSQAALARLTRDAEGKSVAARFELVVNGIELANGYHELTDAAEQEKRFHEDIRKRKERGIDTPQPDPELLAALRAGLPDCAGVALGIDRLLLLRLGKDNLNSVLSYPLLS